jgi:hypothetical protein
MTKFLVTGQADLWNVFWVLAVWSAAYMVAAVILREVFAKPVTPMERYGLWFGRIVGVVGAAIIFAYGYRTTGELDRVERECEHYKALAAAKADRVSEYQPVSYMREFKCDKWSLGFESGDSADGRNRPVFSVRGQRDAENVGSAGCDRGSDSVSGGASRRRAITDGTSAVY